MGFENWVGAMLSSRLTSMLAGIVTPAHYWRLNSQLNHQTHVNVLYTLQRIHASLSINPMLYPVRNVRSGVKAATQLTGSVKRGGFYLPNMVVHHANLSTPITHTSTNSAAPAIAT